MLQKYVKLKEIYKVVSLWVETYFKNHMLFLKDLKEGMKNWIRKDTRNFLRRNNIAIVDNHFKHTVLYCQNKFTDNSEENVGRQQWIYILILKS